MVHAILLRCVILGDGDKPADPSTANRLTYAAARVKAGKDAAAHVQLALWCEAHGMTAERIEHLNLATSLEASNVLAAACLDWSIFRANGPSPNKLKSKFRTIPASRQSFVSISIAGSERLKKPMPSCGSPAGASKTGSKKRQWFTITRSPDSIPLAMWPGYALASRSNETDGRSPTTSPPKRSKPHARSGPIHNGSRDWKNYARACRARSNHAASRPNGKSIRSLTPAPSL